MASDSESDFEVDKVLQKRKSNKGFIEYLIRWKGFGASEDSWEPAKNLTGSKKLLDAFNRSENAKPAGRKSSRSSSRSRSRSRSRGRARSTSKGRKSPGRPKASPGRQKASPGRQRASPGRTPKVETTRRSGRFVAQNEVKVETKKPVEILKADEMDSNTNRSVIRESYSEKVTTTTTTSSSAASETTGKKKGLSEYLSLTRSDYPVMIIFACITLITLSFAVEKYVNCDEIWSRITTGFQNVANKFKWSK